MTSTGEQFNKLKVKCDQMYNQYVKLSEEYTKLQVDNDILKSKYNALKKEQMERVKQEYVKERGVKRSASTAYGDNSRTASQKKVHFDKFHKSDLRSLGRKYSVEKYYTMTKSQLCSALMDVKLDKVDVDALQICNAL